MAEPKLSIIVPAYNAAQYVEACIDSVMSSTFQDFELIIVDDGSKDSTLDIVHGNVLKYNELGGGGK